MKLSSTKDPRTSACNLVENSKIMNINSWSFQGWKSIPSDIRKLLTGTL